MSIALARRYRPRRFADLLVQDHVAAALRGAVVRKRVGHGYLLTGPRGVGKTTAARILAMALNCENPDGTGEPCGECPSCLRIWNGQASLDVVEIDAASNRGVDDARDLRERAMYAASKEGHHKIYIVDEAHMLTREAWNALLKILEEPPPGVVFVFATTEPQKIANTAAPVMSRLQRFDFRRIGPAAIQSRLEQVLKEEKLTADSDALLLIARHADGGMRDALSVLDQCLSFGEGSLTAQRVREVLGLIDDEAFGAILELVAKRRPGDVFGVVGRLSDSGADLVEVSAGLGELLRAVLMSHYGAEPPVLSEAGRQLVARVATELAPEDVLRMLKLLGEAEQPLRRSSNPRMVLETLLLRWAMMDRAAELRSLLSGAAPEPAGSPAPSTPTPSETIPRQQQDQKRAFSVPWTEDGVRAAWPQVVAAATASSRFLGQALEQATPELGELGVLRLIFGPGDDVSRDGVERQRDSLARIASDRLGTEVSIELPEPQSQMGDPQRAANNRPARLTVDQMRQDRLDQLRRNDPGLDALADALDLELIEDS